MDLAGQLVIIVFLITYAAITSEKVNRTAMSLTGMAVVAIILRILTGTTFEEITHHIGWYTILFVTGQMIIVAVSRASGMYQYMALAIAKPTRGDPRRLFITFIVFVFFISLFFDTTSTMLIVGPITVEVCKALGLDFKPFLVSEAIVSNYASIPSVVGDVPNLVIAGVTRINPAYQFVALMPLSFIFLVLSLPLMLRYAKHSFEGHDIVMAEEVFRIDPASLVRSRLEFYMSVVAMIVLILAFTIGISQGVEASLVAIGIAGVMLLVTRHDVDMVLRQVAWGTVFFLIGLFGIVAALEITGTITDLAAWVGTVVGTDKAMATLFMFWIPGLVSSVVDNVPVAALLSPLAVEFSAMSPVLALALVTGVNIGGFLLPIGSPANVIALALSETERDPIGMIAFAKVATPIAILMMLVGTGWLLMLALVFG